MAIKISMTMFIQVWWWLFCICLIVQHSHSFRLYHVAWSKTSLISGLLQSREISSRWLSKSTRSVCDLLCRREDAASKAPSSKVSLKKEHTQNLKWNLSRYWQNTLHFLRNKSYITAINSTVYKYNTRNWKLLNIWTLWILSWFSYLFMQGSTLRTVR